MVSPRRLKRTLLLVSILCFGLFLFYATTKPQQIAPRLEAESTELEQLSTARSTERERDSVDWTQQPGKPGDAWGEDEQGLDDHKEVQETLHWLDRIRANGPGRETTSQSIRTTSERSHPTGHLSEDNEVNSSPSGAVPTSNTEPPTTQESTSNTEPPTTQESTSNTEPPTTQESTSNTEPPTTLESTSNTEPPTTQESTSNTEPPTTQESTPGTTTIEQETSSDGNRNETDVQRNSSEAEATPRGVLASSTSQAGTTAPTEIMRSTQSTESVTDSFNNEVTTSSYPREKQRDNGTLPATTLSTIATVEANNTQGNSTIAYTPAPPENACRLPKLNPWDPSIRHLLRDVGQDPGCEGRYPRVMFDVVSNKLVRLGNSDKLDFDELKVETIHRNEGTDTEFHYVYQGNPFDVSAGQTQISRPINSDYFRLKYKLKGQSDDLTYFFARAKPQPVLKERATKLKQESPRELDLNVYMIGFDSTSRANFFRKMPNSLAFLRNELSTFFFEGFSVIGDATTPALTALLTGRFVADLPEGRRGWSNSREVDDWPWIMKEYEKRGYLTMYAEDDVPVSAFNLRLLGFKNPPAHHYIRPFWMAVERDGARDGPGVCSKSTTMVNYTLEYVTSFHEAYPDSSKFVFSFMSYIAHAHPNHLSYADKDLLRFLTTFVRRRQHDNTILIVFGDHGSRNDDVRDTMQGKLEERLPWLSISVPKWLRDKHPDVMRALAHNQHVIATPFDLHATLRHVLTFPETPPAEKNAQSLFTKLDTSRTCGDAGIDEHWCPCLQFEQIGTDSPDVKKFGAAIVNFINGLISKQEYLRSSCAKLELKEVHAAFKYAPNEKLRRFESTNQDSDRAVNFGSSTQDNPHYQVTVQTAPGDGLFEATVTVEGQDIKVNPEISRINRYGDQARCVLRTNPYARKYCFCLG